MMTIKSKPLRRAIGIAVPFVVIPAVVIAGAYVFSDKSYAYGSLAVAALSLLLFVSGFERRSTGTRRMIIIAVMTALAVVGRILFSPIPGFMPVTAFAVITGMYLGGESGFLVGALSALISNFYAGQGAWTPFQMLAWGIVGLVAGLLASPLKSSRLILIIYAVIAGVAYSFIMDIWTVLWYNNSFSFKLYLAALATSVPHTLSYALSNVVFLWLLGKPFGEKLERLKVKYGV